MYGTKMTLTKTVKNYPKSGDRMDLYPAMRHSIFIERKAANYNCKYTV